MRLLAVVALAALLAAAGTTAAGDRREARLGALLARIATTARAPGGVMIAASSGSAVDDRYGLGLMGFDTGCGPVWGHRGRIAGYTAFAFASPDSRRSVVVMLNVGRIADAAVARLNPLVFAALCA